MTVETSDVDDPKGKHQDMALEMATRKSIQYVTESSGSMSDKVVALSREENTSDLSCTHCGFATTRSDVMENHIKQTHTEMSNTLTLLQDKIWQLEIEMGAKDVKLKEQMAENKRKSEEINALESTNEKMKMELSNVKDEAKKIGVLLSSKEEEIKTLNKTFNESLQKKEELEKKVSTLNNEIAEFKKDDKDIEII